MPHSCSTSPVSNFIITTPELMYVKSRRCISKRTISTIAAYFDHTTRVVLRAGEALLSVCIRCNNKNETSSAGPVSL